MKTQTDIKAARQRVLANVQAFLKPWRALALRIHAHPELGYEEHKASAWLCEALEQAGFEVDRGVAGMPTAFRAAVDTAADAPVVAFLAEYDALPETGHACGHNLSGVASCLAGHALADAVRDEPAGVRVLGTPAEEGGNGGKLHMLEHGIFDEVDFAMMAHAGFMNLPHREMLGRRVIEATFQAPAVGKVSGHEGPSLARDDELPADVTSGNAQDAALLSLQGAELLRRKTRPRTRIEAGLAEGGRAHGGKLRGRPDYSHARVEFLIEGTTVRYIERLEQRLAGIARAAAEATGTELIWSGRWNTYLPMRRNPALEASYGNSLGVIGEPIGRFPADWSIGSTDCGNVSQKLPTIHPYFKAAEPDAGIDHHTHAFAEVTRSEGGLAGMVVAAQAMALAGLDLLLDENLRRRVRHDFEADEH